LTPELKTRGVHLPQDYQILSTIDKEILSSDEGHRASQIAQEYKYHGLASHVLLAACKADELSREFKKRGCFTVALLKVLRDPTVRLDAITYRGVIDRLDDIPYVICILYSACMLFIFLAATKRRNVKADLTIECFLIPSCLGGVVGFSIA
jgi:hypothetical protein